MRTPALRCAGLAGPIALVGTLSYILCFAMGAGPVPGLLVPEITAARIRGARAAPGGCGAALQLVDVACALLPVRGLLTLPAALPSP